MSEPNPRPLQARRRRARPRRRDRRPPRAQGPARSSPWSCATIDAELAGPALRRARRASRSSTISSPSSPAARSSRWWSRVRHDTWKVVRTLMGARTRARRRRARSAATSPSRRSENLVHGSDGPESAGREIALFFPDTRVAQPRPGAPVARPPAPGTTASGRAGIGVHRSRSLGPCHAIPGAASGRSMRRDRNPGSRRSSAATWPSTSALRTPSSTCAVRASCSTSRRSSRSTRGRAAARGRRRGEADDRPHARATSRRSAR